MANVVYTKFLAEVAKGTIDLDAAGTVVRMLLVRDTSTYVADKDDEFVSDLAGLVEISVASYARQTLASKAVSVDATNDWALWDCDDVSFGSLETGQTVLAVILYVQTGGNDASPSDDTLIMYIDTAATLPFALQGAAYTVTINSGGLLQFFQFES
jgi:hypothetical protein